MWWLVEEFCAPEACSGTPWLKEIWYVTYYHTITARRSGNNITVFLAAEKTLNILVGINHQIEDKMKARKFLIFVALFMDKSLETFAFLRLSPSNTQRSDPSPHPSD